MSKAQTETRKGLVRLLQTLLSGPLGLEEEGGEILLVLPAGTRRRFARPLVEACERQGMLRRQAGQVAALPEARTALKRLIAGAGLGFLDQHGPLEKESRPVDGAETDVLVNRKADPLGALARLKDRDGTPWFAPEVLAAGRRLAADFHFGGLQPKITASLEPQISSASRGGRGAQAEMSDHTADARARVARAATALGPELSGVALDVCCFEKGLEQVEQERHWPARSAKLMLRTALQALDRHYQMPRRQGQAAGAIASG